MDGEHGGDRTREWFVPSFGPPRFRVFVGLLFLPYTAMVLGFTLIGAMLAETVDWKRVMALTGAYFIALGVGAHALDAVGSKGRKPWGRVFGDRQLWTLAVVSVAAAYAILIPYMIADVPLLWPIAIAEGFFLVAYNLELFGGRFHTDGWFALSWGGLPVTAGYVMQTDSLSIPVIMLAGAAAFFSLVEIKASRPYKVLRREGSSEAAAVAHAAAYEAVLKSISGGVVLTAAGLTLWRAWA